MNKTAIGWTDFSANPLKYRDSEGRVRWACAKVSAGCTNCYSEALAKRWNRGADYNLGEVEKLTPFLDEKELHAMMTSKAIAGKRVFVGDMTDIFGEWVPDLMLAELWTIFSQRPDVTFQVLTKRAERMSKHWAKDIKPLPNVWIGVSCEDQERANERIPFLLQTPAAVRFVSAEPLLGPLDFVTGGELTDVGHIDWLRGFNGCKPVIPKLDWVIIGGESGPQFRACKVEAITNLAFHCQFAGVPVFVKQDAHRLPGQRGRIPDAFWLKEFPA